jgi:hypothetical protein
MFFYIKQQHQQDVVAACQLLLAASSRQSDRQCITLTYTLTVAIESNLRHINPTHQREVFRACSSTILETHSLLGTLNQMDGVHASATDWQQLSLQEQLRQLPAIWHQRFSHLVTCARNLCLVLRNAIDVGAVANEPVLTTSLSALEFHLTKI